MINWPVKDPDEVKDYSWRVPLDEGDAIASFVAIGGGSVTIDRQETTDDLATLWLSGGVSGEDAVFSLRVTTANGRTFEETARLAVAEKNAPLVIADGSYYGTVAGYRAHHMMRGKDVSDQTSERIESALLVASEWLDGAYHTMWPGRRMYGTLRQERDWPRYDVVDIDGYSIDNAVVPVEIERATYEIAARWIDNPTVLNVDYTPNKYRRVSIDGALSVEYRTLDAASAQVRFPVLGQVLARIMGGGNGSLVSGGIVRV